MFIFKCTYVAGSELRYDVRGVVSSVQPECVVSRTIRGRRRNLWLSRTCSVESLWNVSVEKFWFVTIVPSSLNYQNIYRFLLLLFTSEIGFFVELSK